MARLRGISGPPGVFVDGVEQPLFQGHVDEYMKGVRTKLLEWSLRLIEQVGTTFISWYESMSVTRGASRQPHQVLDSAALNGANWEQHVFINTLDSMSVAQDLLGLVPSKGLKIAQAVAITTIVVVSWLIVSPTTHHARKRGQRRVGARCAAAARWWTCGRRCARQQRGTPVWLLHT